MTGYAPRSREHRAWECFVLSTNTWTLLSTYLTLHQRNPKRTKYKIWWSFYNTAKYSGLAKTRKLSVGAGRFVFVNNPETHQFSSQIIAINKATNKLVKPLCSPGKLKGKWLTMPSCFKRIIICYIEGSAKKGLRWKKVHEYYVEGTLHWLMWSPWCA